jgi:putative ABC transport system permease protein
MLLVGFTLVALLLAAIGLYGVMAYTVAQRTREIGIRIALGATRRTIARAVVSQGVILAAAGVAIGLTGAWWAVKLLTKMLYGVAPTDPASFTIGAALLLGTALLACVVPMRRAVRVDPVIAMRVE